MWGSWSCPRTGFLFLYTTPPRIGVQIAGPRIWEPFHTALLLWPKGTHSVSVTLKTRLAGEPEGLAAPASLGILLLCFCSPPVLPPSACMTLLCTVSSFRSTPSHPNHSSNVPNFLLHCCSSTSLTGLGGKGHRVVVGTMAGVPGTLVLPRFCSLGPNSLLIPPVLEHGPCIYT